MAARFPARLHSFLTRDSDTAWVIRRGSIGYLCAPFSGCPGSRADNGKVTLRALVMTLCASGVQRAFVEGYDPRMEKEASS